MFEDFRRRHRDLSVGMRRMQVVEHRAHRYRAVHSPEVLFRQRLKLGRLGLSDFTATKHLAVLISDEPLVPLFVILSTCLQRP